LTINIDRWSWDVHMKAPIVLFVYKRLESLQNCVFSLKTNAECEESDLYIFSDAPRTDNDESKVQEVRSFIETISGFKTVHLIKASENRGLAPSVISGVTEVINQFGKVIVLEDDLVVAENFLSYMNQALDFYCDKDKVLSISGFTLPVKLPAFYPYDVYFTQRVFSWGWATWKHKWENIDWAVKDYDDFVFNSERQKAFNGMGTDLSQMLHRQMQGKINSWAIRWCYHQFKFKLYTVFPVHSKVINTGFTSEATHSGTSITRYKTTIQNGQQKAFAFSPEAQLHPFIIKQFLKHFSIPVRAYYKVVDRVNKILSH
jgi:hypothetical protein